MSGQSMGSIAWLMLIALSIVWGGSYFFVEIALEAHGPLTIVTARITIGALGLLAVLVISGQRLPGTVVAWRDLLVMGVLNNVLPFSLITWGQTHIDAGPASILNATTPFFTIALAHFLLSGERATRARLAGIALGIGGVAVLAGPSALEGLSGGIQGQTAVLAAAASYAFAGIWGKRRLGGMAPMAAAAGMLVASSVVIVPITLAVEGTPNLSMDIEIWGALIGIGLLSASLAYFLYFKILAVAGANNLLLVTMLIPVTALLLSGLILDEKVAAGALMGMGLIGLGLVVIDGRVMRELLAVRRAA
jgi:drug/metabolite transporter (DMT)-like permease